MMTRNIPVPAGPRAPVGWRWCWWIGPPAAITWLYRTLLPPDVRSWWCRPGHSTSHIALALILAGGGWGTFFRNAWPRSGLEASWPPKYGLRILDPGGKKGWYVNGHIRGPQLGWKEDYGRGNRVGYNP